MCIRDRLTNRDYDEYDLLIGMDQANLRDIYRICGGDYAGKMSLLMDHTTHPGNVADPWYTEDFEATATRGEPKPSPIQKGPEARASGPFISNPGAVALLLLSLIHI